MNLSIACSICVTKYVLQFIDFDMRKRTFKKRVLAVVCLALAIALFGCSSADDETNTQKIEVNETGNVPETIEDQEQVKEDLNDYKTAPFKAVCKETIKIRFGPSVDDDVKGYVRKGDFFEVYETVEKDGYIWNRIASDAWIANDGTWLERVPYDTDFSYVKADLLVVKEFPEKIEGSFYYSSGGTVYSKGNETFSFQKADNGFIDRIQYKSKGEANVIDENGKEVIMPEETSYDLTWAFPFGISPFCYQNSVYNTQVERDYDSQGNIVKEKTFGPHSYVYNADGTLKQMVYKYDQSSAEYTVSYFYDDGRLKKTVAEQYDPQGDDFFNGMMETHELEYNGNLVFVIPTEMGNIFAETYKCFRLDEKGRIIEEYEIHALWHDWFYHYK